MKRLKYIAVAVAAIAAVLGLGGQNLKRPVPKGANVYIAPAEQCDTLRGAVCDSIVVSGFDKPLRDNRETMFVSNRSATDITGVILTVDYLDMSGRQLHQSTQTVEVALPGGQTRRVTIKSFDRGGAFYYHLTPLPRGARQATPFDVKVSVDAVLVSR